MQLRSAPRPLSHFSLSLPDTWTLTPGPCFSPYALSLLTPVSWLLAFKSAIRDPKLGTRLQGGESKRSADNLGSAFGGLFVWYLIFVIWNFYFQFGHMANLIESYLSSSLFQLLNHPNRQ
jgi:hypothetical protein